MKNTLEKCLLSLAKTSVLNPEFLKSDYVSLDLSIKNKDLDHIDTSSSKVLGHYINNHINLKSAKVAFGGYLETRNIYQRSNYFNNSTVDTERNIHLGLDFWVSAGTPVYAAFDGTVHSFKNNINFGDYGPVIILKHTLKNIEFHTLYGHLSLASIEHLKVGQVFKRGEQIATLGDVSINGDYAPHLHFQIIKNMQGNFGDYPGVCSKKDIEFYKQNCPNPELLFDLNS